MILGGLDLISWNPFHKISQKNNNFFNDKNNQTKNDLSDEDAAALGGDCQSSCTNKFFRWDVIKEK